MSLRLVPTDVQAARRFVAEHHRHSKAPKRWLFAAGVANGGSDDLVGVVIAGRPKAQALCDGYTLEVLRCCSDGTANAPSMLYAAVARAARALGYKRVITYTLESEPGTTLRACGWRPMARTRARPWHNNRPRYDSDLFGVPQTPPGPRSAGSGASTRSCLRRSGRLSRSVQLPKEPQHERPPERHRRADPDRGRPDRAVRPGGGGHLPRLRLLGLRRLHGR